MNAKYFRWVNGTETPYGCVLGKIVNLGKLRPLWRGESLQGRFPDDVEIQMNPEFPDHTVLTDNLDNRHHLIVASEKLMYFFESFGDPEIELLPVSIRDHKGKIAAKYFLIHPLSVADCLNYDASGAVLVPGSETVLDIDRLVVNGAALDSAGQLVRIAKFPDGILVREDLAAALTREAFTGILLQELTLAA